MKENIKKNFKLYLIAFIVSLLIGAAIFCISFFSQAMTIIAACNGTILAFAILLGLALLITVARFGAFDTFAYGFKQLGSSIFGRSPKKYDDLVMYKNVKVEERKTKSNYQYIMMFASLLFLIANIVLEIIYHTIIGQ